MAAKEGKTAGLIDTIKQYIDLKAEHYKLSFVEKISLLIGQIVLMFFIAIFVLTLVLLAIVISYSLLLSLIGVPWIVALIEIGSVALLLTLLLVFKDKLVIEPVANAVIKTLLGGQNESSKKEEDDDE